MQRNDFKPVAALHKCPGFFQHPGVIGERVKYNKSSISHDAYPKIAAQPR